MPEAKPIYQVKVGERVIDLLPDFRCLECGRTLARVLEHEDRTAICILGAEGGIMYVTRAQLRCMCGAERSFFSVPMSALRLGIVEAE